jgi:hypothetical protein
MEKENNHHKKNRVLEETGLLKVTFLLISQ